MTCFMFGNLFHAQVDLKVSALVADPALKHLNSRTEFKRTASLVLWDIDLRD